MAVRPIVIYPSPILRRKAMPVELDGNLSSLFQLFEDMEDTLEKSDRGAALAANQIGSELQVFVTNQTMTGTSSDPIVRNIPPFIINPRITSSSAETDMLDEGCLSFPGINMKVRRFRDTYVTYDTVLKIDGKQTVFRQCGHGLFGFWSQVFQHEIDHLNGRLFVDSLSDRKRFEIANSIRKNK